VSCNVAMGKKKRGCNSTTGWQKKTTRIAEYKNEKLSQGRICSLESFGQKEQDGSHVREGGVGPPGEKGEE